MTAVLQRVTEASVAVRGIVRGQIKKGLLILLGVKKGDTGCDAIALAEKISKLRIFSDENGKMNLSVIDIDGGALVVSQFTLCANYSHGNRPDFLCAAPPAEAGALYKLFTAQLGARIGEERVETGEFGADMQVSLTNDGPVTIVMESGVLI
jgi:D-tyrosyl-tRNA(Tyr) deacylase